LGLGGVWAGSRAAVSRMGRMGNRMGNPCRAGTIDEGAWGRTLVPDAPWRSRSGRELWSDPPARRVGIPGRHTWRR
jgi:hypothetical protein